MTGRATPLAAEAATRTPAPTWPGLLGSEVLRARSRRSLPWLAAVALLGSLATAALLFVGTGPVDAAALAAAGDRGVAEQSLWLEDCLADPSIPAAEKDEWCSPIDEDQIRADAHYFLSRQPFTAGSMSLLLGAAGGLSAVVGLLLGATAGGADWGARTMGQIFSWEPRRLRVLAARLGVTLGAALAIAVLALAIAWGLGMLTTSAHALASDVSLPGDPSPVAAGQALLLALRWLPLVALSAAAAFALGMATRSTGFAVGAALAFTLVIQTALVPLWPWLSQWLITPNALAWLAGGTEWIVSRSFFQGSGDGSGFDSGTIWITPARGLLTLALWTLALLVLAAVLVRRRDVD